MSKMTKKYDEKGNLIAMVDTAKNEFAIVKGFKVTGTLGQRINFLRRREADDTCKKNNCIMLDDDKESIADTPFKLFYPALDENEKPTDQPLLDENGQPVPVSEEDIAELCSWIYVLEHNYTEGAPLCYLSDKGGLLKEKSSGAKSEKKAKKAVKNTVVELVYNMFKNSIPAETIKLATATFNVNIDEILEVLTETPEISKDELIKLFS